LNKEIISKLNNILHNEVFKENTIYITKKLFDYYTKLTINYYNKLQRDLNIMNNNTKNYFIFKILLFSKFIFIIIFFLNLFFN